MAFRFTSGLVLAAIALACAPPGFGQSPAVAPPTPQPSLSGSISGTVFDQSGAVVAGARVTLALADQSISQQMSSGEDGQFFFANLAAGAFQLTIAAPGFAMQTSSGVLHPGEAYVVPQIALLVATDVTDVEVGLSQTEVAQEQIKVEEKQRVMGVIPNFYVTYAAHPVPLTAKQKFGLAWRTSVDPISLALVGAVAGVQQSDDEYEGYGQGTAGYAKRYGAAYANFVSGTFIGAAVLPSLLKQDPRYFYKGTGNWRSRSLYAMANAVICKGDNGRWQTNYSNIVGSMAAGGISNLYYPARDRGGAQLTIENGLIGIGATAVANLFQEFVVRRLTPKSRDRHPSTP
jgi:hypothetical protein